jgi:GNAT superfamily N-acetyltransferase
MSKETVSPLSAVRVIRSESDAEQLDHFKVRFEAFKEATPYEGGDAGSPYEVDLFDAMRDTRTLFTAYIGDEPVGAVRVLWGGSALGRVQGWRSGLPFESNYDLGDLASSGRLAEPGRLCVLSAYRGTRVALHLIEAVFEACRERGVDLLVAPANTETDAAEDIAILGGVLSARKLVSEEHRFARKVPEGGPARVMKPLYDAAEREGAARGSVVGLELPRTLKLYGRLGARVVGDAVFDRKFGLYALPILVPVPAKPLFAKAVEEANSSG